MDPRKDILDEEFIAIEAEIPQSIPPYQDEEDTIKMTDDELQDCLTRASVFPSEHCSTE